ncbi:uncharacterized protein BKCO1_1000244 [Diplodia corticola]|uniref:Uncharacterized protein n=1 Tax=Diplodia corticola TaxID=236234 RepID=A0A1J9RGR4_9PEZI|nr:uncharacterized protein BKCO1_1000244 [Diplodia corticola]OJD40734.1 hypothetical protein BKCO1_1000244 [Diplodia corticola]
MHAPSLFTALVMGVSSVSAFALTPRRPAAVNSVTLWNGVERKDGRDANGNPLDPQSYTVTLSDGPNSCFNLADLDIDNKTSSVSVPKQFSCTVYE